MIYRNFFGGEKLPKPLSQNDFEYYFRLYKNGDINARNILIERNLKLVLSIVGDNFNSTKYDIDDLISNGVIGLMKAIDSFDIDKKSTISTYASRCIKNEILTYMRNNKKHEDIPSLDTPISVENEEYSLTICDTLIDDNIDIEEYSLNLDFRNNFIKFIKNTLNEKEFKVIFMYFGFIGNRKFLQEEIATTLGMTRPNVSKILNRALKKIKNKIIKEKSNITDTENYLSLLNEAICFDGTIKYNNIKKLIK